MERLLDEVSFDAPELGGRIDPDRRGVRRSHARGHRRRATICRGTSCERVEPGRRSGRRAGGAVVVAPACGKTGPPLPPLRPLPGRIADAARQRDRRPRRDCASRCRPRTPTARRRRRSSASRSTASPQPAATPPPTLAQLTVDQEPEIARDRAAAAAGEGGDAASAARRRRDAAIRLPGDVAHVSVTPSRRASAAPTRRRVYYVVVGRGRTRTARAAVPDPGRAARDRAGRADRPRGRRTTRKRLKVSWSPGAADRVPRLRRREPRRRRRSAGAAPVAGRGRSPRRSSSARSAASSCVRCTVAGPTSVEGAPSAPACVTPVDTFPPPAPTSCAAIPGDGAVALSWNAVTAADLAGYVVLRGDGSGDTLQPLMTAAIDATTLSRHDGDARRDVHLCGRRGGRVAEAQSERAVATRQTAVTDP